MYNPHGDVGRFFLMGVISQSARQKIRDNNYTDSFLHYFAANEEYK
jgi:hypothetical protein